MIVPSKCIRAARISGRRLRISQPKLLAVAAAMAAFVVTGTSVAWCFPWSIDMYRGPAVQPLEVSPRVMPEGTLPVDTGLPPQSLEQATVKAHNPLKPTPENIAHGKELYDNNCAPCHGETADGNGPAAHLQRAHSIYPKNLVTGVSKSLPDGYIYGYIRDGGFHMPAYADAMDANERWDVVMYLRQLQAQAAKATPKTASK